jgi:flagellar hook-associated protein 3 FlgL
MRISTNTIYQNGISRISDLQSEQSKLQQQISTGRRILTPADDPVGASHALEIQQAQSVNSQYAANRVAAQRNLGIEESTLSSVTDLIVSVQSTMVSAGNAALSDTERGYLATQLQGSLDELIGLANSKDGAGAYMFAGYQTATQPFVKTITGAQYLGDAGQRLVQVDASRQMAVADTGDSVFQGNGQDVFKTMTDLITLLQTPTPTPADKAALTAGLVAADTGMQAALDSVLTTRAMVGSRLNELDALDVFGQSRDLQYAQTLSETQDLDYAKALSQVSQQQTILTAAQKSFVAITSLSLFDFIR